ncbi:condensation domain-containing protein [Dyadobacter jiangsuensis]|uniref:Condensation domain-containing protein n=1 Tax=Dyadobacter jiangsuensis TaxID=1591085 RepID=A0A2P8G239_9BACT|nr:condensation domain-containing protein [Dyadobacter jiangsuensis]PSL28021.1 condensation domain-containing protein [Dyadobacter jiangsuensis]
MNRQMIVGERIMYADGLAPVNCVFAATIEGHFSEQQVAAALAKIQNRHPLLRTNVRKNGTNVPSFVTNPDISPIPIHIIERTSDIQWEEISLLEWEKQFDLTKGPAARLVWLQSETVSDLLLVCPHCVCDGSGFVTLMRELLLLLDNPDMELEAYEGFQSVHSLVPISIRDSRMIHWKGKLFSALAKGLFTILNPKPAPRTGNYYLLTNTLDKETTAALVRKCKAEKTTIQAALCTASLLAHRSVKGKASWNKVISPVDIRRYLPAIGRDHLFAFAPIVELSLSKQGEPDDFWAEARRMKQALVEKTDQVNAAEMMFITEYFHGSTDALLRHMRSTKGSHDITISNMGVLDIPASYNNFRVRALHSPSVGFPWRNPNTLVVSTFSGKMDLTFSSHESFLSIIDAEKICREAMWVLLEGMRVAATHQA